MKEVKTFVVISVILMENMELHSFFIRLTQLKKLTQKNICCCFTSWIIFLFVIPSGLGVFTFCFVS